MLNKIKQFFSNEKGAETLEYAVIAGIIVIIGVAAYNTGGINGIINSMFGAVNTAVGNVTSG